MFSFFWGKSEPSLIQPEAGTEIKETSPVCSLTSFDEEFEDVERFIQLTKESLTPMQQRVLEAVEKCNSSVVEEQREGLQLLADPICKI
jgi:hypothetical protein